jgi:hypothetical protein
MKSRNLRLLWLGAGVLLGGLSGFLYHYYIGCNGSCMIWASPWIATGYGALLGWLAFSLAPVGLKRRGGKDTETDSVDVKEVRS